MQEVLRLIPASGFLDIDEPKLVLCVTFGHRLSKTCGLWGREMSLSALGQLHKVFVVTSKSRLKLQAFLSKKEVQRLCKLKRAGKTTASRVKSILLITNISPRSWWYASALIYCLMELSHGNVACVAWRFKRFFNQFGEPQKRAAKLRGTVVFLPGSSRLWASPLSWPRQIA